MIAILIGLLTGFLMCIPIGPLNVWVIQTVVKKSSTAALLIALGGSLMDVVYFYAILSGLTLVEIPAHWNQYLKIAGIALIIILGIKELLNPPNPDQIQRPTAPSKVGLGKMSGYFILGVVIYTSNPTLLITMTGLATFIKSLGLFEFIQFNIILLSLALGLGSFLWFAFLTMIVKRHEQTIRSKYLKKFSTVSGVLMIALGLIMGFRI